MIEMAESKEAAQAIYAAYGIMNYRRLGHDTYFNEELEVAEVRYKHALRRLKRAFPGAFSATGPSSPQRQCTGGRSCWKQLACRSRPRSTPLAWSASTSRWRRCRSRARLGARARCTRLAAMQNETDAACGGLAVYFMKGNSPSCFCMSRGAVSSVFRACFRVCGRTGRNAKKSRFREIVRVVRVCVTSPIAPKMLYGLSRLCAAQKTVSRESPQIGQLTHHGIGSICGVVSLM